MNAKQRAEIEERESSTESGRHDAALEQVRQSLKDLRYGSVTVIVQDGVVIQIERTEKLRFRK